MVKHFKKIAKNFSNDQQGTAAIEYGLVAFFISVAIVVSVTDIGTSLTFYQKF